MATIAEKIRACVVLGGFGAVDVEDSDGVWREVLTLSSGDIVAIADALEEHDASESRGQAVALRMEERAADAEPTAWAWLEEGCVVTFTCSEAAARIWTRDGKDVAPLYQRPPVDETDALRAELDAAKAEIAALYAKSMNRAVERDEWRVNALAAEKRVAELEAKLAGRDVKAEALPSREDLETVLWAAVQVEDLRLETGKSPPLEFFEREGEYGAGEYGRHTEYVTFPEAIAKAAALLRAKKAEG